ncbi:DUF4132 domain-containing protein [Paracoccus caeni]|uniref:DUF4132 domain-containing protein n=1 Tax=Paracoccus caeni TaxID=657651 RepID=A0A934SF49_9RHOB|nr:DUF4132 domain-containing protein [Paracoccus caeni]MBK4216234.1 DUF4132 domain-containing protein [Paracoccus caeni]
MTDRPIDRARSILEAAVSPPDDFGELAELTRQLSPEDLGDLIPLAWRVRGQPGLDRRIEPLASSIEFSGKQAVFRAQSFDEGLSALRWLIDNWTPEPSPDPRYSPEDVKLSRIIHLLRSMILRMREEPEAETRSRLQKMLPLLDRRHQPEERLAAASLAQDPAAIATALAAWQASTKGELARTERGIYAKAGALPLIRFLEHRYLPYGAQPDPEARDAFATLVASTPDYADFARSIVEQAVIRMADIAEGRVSYKADGAFVVDDCGAIARAVMFGLARSEQWCMAAIGPIWRMASVAPDPKAKTMPSQSLTLQLANATIYEPRPEAISIMRDVAASCRHAGVKKKLERLLRTARSSLIARPEGLLDLPADEPISKDMQLPFRDAVQSLMAEPAALPAVLWLQRFGPDRKHAWNLSRDLIWQVVADGKDMAVTAMPVHSGKTLQWRLQDNGTRPFDPNDLVRLWHPVETPDELAKEWRFRLEENGQNQPFPQAGREIYRPASSEMDGRVISAFAGQMISGTPLMGLARSQGWRFGFDNELHLHLSGVDFTFSAGARAYPGSGGGGTTGNLWLVGPQKRLDQVPGRILSEVMRKTDLLVSVGGRS